jgi:hypothetical protein
MGNVAWHEIQYPESHAGGGEGLYPGGYRTARTAHADARIIGHAYLLSVVYPML